MFDDDHGHPVLAFLTVLNTLVLVALLYLQIGSGLLDLGGLPVVGSLLGRTASPAVVGEEVSTSGTPTPGARSAATRTAATGTPTPASLRGGDSVLVKRGAEFRSSGDLKQGVFCRLTDDTPGSIINQEPAKSTDSQGRPRTVYPVEVRDAPCEGGGKVADVKGWVSEEFLKRP